MNVTQEVQVVLFKPEGSINLQGGMALKAKMVNVVPKPNQLWIIDLLAVDFMDSSGLISLVQGLKFAHQNGCRLVICNLQAPVRLILELTQLDSVFEIFHTYEDILTAIDNQGMIFAN
jgi:anti-anti-sigma factor